jgi:hypothetical protein
VGGKVPAARDEVVIASNHQVEFDGPANHQDECAKLTIQAGAALYFSQTATSFQVGGDGPGIPGGIDVAGVLTVRAGVTVEIDPVDPEGDDRDTDGDGLIDRWDNCPGIANPGWRDADQDGLGDACDP